MQLCSVFDAYFYFLEIKKAHDKITNEDQRKNCIRIIENAIEDVEKERRMKLKKFKASDLPDLEESKVKAIMKAFATIENRRRNVEKREADARRREQEQEDLAKEKVKSLSLSICLNSSATFGLNLSLYRNVLSINLTKNGPWQNAAINGWEIGSGFNMMVKKRRHFNLVKVGRPRSAKMAKNLVFPKETNTRRNGSELKNVFYNDYISIYLYLF